MSVLPDNRIFLEKNEDVRLKCSIYVSQLFETCFFFISKFSTHTVLSACFVMNTNHLT